MPKSPRENEEPVYRHCLKAIESSPNVSIALESEWALARRFAVSRRTARRALQQLVREGRADCFAGKGYFIRPQTANVDLTRLKVGIVHEAVRRHSFSVVHTMVADYCKSLESHNFAPKLLTIQLPQSGILTQGLLAGFSVDAYLLCSVSPAVQAFFAAQRKPAVVLGNTVRELGLASVSLDELEVSRQVTEEVLASGHRSVALVQEKTLNLGAERSRVGFVYAHHAQRARFHQERIVRVDREKAGAWQSLRVLFNMAPSAMLVESTPLFEFIWSRATGKYREWLSTTETIVLDADSDGALVHPARILKYDVKWESEAAIRLLEGCIRGRKNTQQHYRIPWTLSEPIRGRRQ